MTNEPVRSYDPKTPEGQVQIRLLQKRMDELAGKKIEIPLIIGGKEVRTGHLKKVVIPHQHSHVLAEFHLATEKELLMAVDAALQAKSQWENLSPNERSAVFQKAADLLAGPWRDTINAATMLGQSKTVYQAEIDSACELIDFLRFNSKFYSEILDEQPLSSAGVWNQTDWRPLEGFVFAITPFNFTAIAGNLCAAPALVGNTVVWKPSDTQMFSAHFLMKLFEEAGLPPGVINRVAADGPLAGKTLLPHRDLAGVHFTGSTRTFQSIWKTVSENIENYKTYPKLVGETGGKDFIFVHPNSNTKAVIANAVRGAFEFQGQKCSAASRMYVPSSLWAEIKAGLLKEIKSIRMGDVRDFSNFMGAVIDERSFLRIKDVLQKVSTSAASGPTSKIIAGGNTNSEKGYFIEPTLIETTDPKSLTMVEEIFGPVLTVYVYEDGRLDETLELCNSTSPYALTGAIFATRRDDLVYMAKKLRHAAGNFYLNDKPTGAVVGQQPFGGARASGTNDKAGSKLNLYRWLSPRTIKETFVPAEDYRYPFLG